MNDSPLLLSKRNMGKIPLQDALHASLRICEKQFLQINKIKSPYAQKVALIRSIYYTRLLIARYLSLYRCYTRSKSDASLDVSKCAIENMFQQTNILFHSLSRTLRSGIYYLPSCATEINFIDFQITESNLIYSYKSALVTLLQQDIPPRVRNIRVVGRRVVFSAGPEYTFSIIALKKTGKPALSSFRMAWPDLGENPSVKVEQEKLIQKAAAICSKIVAENPSQFLIELDNCIHSFYLYGELLRTSRIVKEHESIYGYETEIFSRNEDEGGSGYDERNADFKVMIRFPHYFYPRNQFTITPLNTGVYLRSVIPLVIRCEIFTEADIEFITYQLDGLNEKEINSVLTQIRDIVFFSKILTIYERFGVAYSFVKVAKLYISEDRRAVEGYALDDLVFRIKLDSKTGEPIIDYCDASNLSIFLTKAISCFDFDRFQYLRTFYMNVFFRKLLVNTVGPHFECIGNINTFAQMDTSQRTAFSFAPSCGIVLGDGFFRPTIKVIAGDEYITTDSILAFNNIEIRSFGSWFHPAFYESRIMILLRQLMQNLNDRGIEVKQIDNTVKFSLEPFGLVIFKLRNDSFWTLDFINPDIGKNDDFSIKIVSRHISSRFIDWLMHLIFKVSTFLQILRQVNNVQSAQSVIKKVYMTDHFQYKVIFQQPFCTPMMVKLVGIQFDHSENGNKEVFKANPSVCIFINCVFLRSYQLKSHMTSLFTSSAVTYCFGPFLLAYMVPLQKFQDIFFSDMLSVDDWSATSIREGCSFFLIYKKLYTIYTIITCSQMFQFMFPPGGKSCLLQIALSGHPNFLRQRQKYSTLKVHMSQIWEVKQLVEDFFDDHGLLESLHFSKISFQQKHSGPALPQLTCSPPQYCQNITCTLDSNGIHIDVLDNGPKYLKALLSIPIVGRKANHCFIKFIFSAIQLGTKGIEFLQILKDVNEIPGHLLDWQKSVENDGINVNRDDMTISMSLITKFGNFFLEVQIIDNSDVVSLTSVEGFQIDDVRTIGKIKSWFKSFMSDETDLNVDDNDPSDNNFFM